ncbi:MAG TPA: 16S rRNA (guanine(527)-N(7))-methyltransferase RsmG [Tepidisphaeraceae bacterium]|jgi:16S rRNA (guanine527-N7)-methyltransferase|nr:16S rRNA (guanine(527)-N(7))-methyltransferase RsmG [Tepidisphaeraceae bacterium]
MIDLWHHLAGSAGLQLTQQQHALLDQYLDLLLKANETINLTRITERADAEIGHVGDALTLLPFLPKGSHGLADVGSGGGVPGIPLAIVRPDSQVILIESTQKKAAFLGKAIETLRLRNVQLFIDRAESAGRGNARESFDVVTARAVGPMNLLVEWCLPLVKTGGKFLAMKGAKVIEELAEADKIIPKLGGGPPAIHRAQLPGTDHHVIVEVPKIARSDAKYPRPPTSAKKKPLR